MFSETSHKGKSRLLVIVFVDGTEIEVGVMILSNHFEYILVFSLRTSEFGFQGNMIEPLVSNIFELEIDFRVISAS